LANASDGEGGFLEAVHHKDPGLGSVHKSAPGPVDTAGGTAPPIRIGADTPEGAIASTKSSREALEAKLIATFQTGEPALLGFELGAGFSFSAQGIGQSGPFIVGRQPPTRWTETARIAYRIGIVKKSERTTHHNVTIGVGPGTGGEFGPGCVVGGAIGNRIPVAVTGDIQVVLHPPQARNVDRWVVLRVRLRGSLLRGLRGYKWAVKEQSPKHREQGGITRHHQHHALNYTVEVNLPIPP